MRNHKETENEEMEMKAIAKGSTELAEFPSISHI